MDHFQQISIELVIKILKTCTPRDVARSTVLNKRFQRIAHLDLVWNHFLPSNAKEIAGQVDQQPLIYYSDKELYDTLASSVWIEYGVKRYWIEPNTGGVCMSWTGGALDELQPEELRYVPRYAFDDFATRAEDISYASNYELPKPDFSNPDLPHEGWAYWLDKDGEVKVDLPPGDYTFSWQLGLKNLAPRREAKRILHDLLRLSITFTLCVDDISLDPMTVELSEWQLTGEDYIVYHVGHFTVPKDFDAEDKFVTETKLQFSLTHGNAELYPNKLLVFVDGMMILSGNHA